jgi:hypothetical protein
MQKADVTRLRIAHTEWVEAAHLHRERALHYTGPARWRKDRGEPHPIEDFLFHYYPFPFSLLEEWHPGMGVAVACSQDDLPAPFQSRHHVYEDGCVRAHPRHLTEKERARMEWMVDLLERTAERAPHYACHGLHEWAMVYGGAAVRHENTLRLRLSPHEIDAVVQSRAITCTHYDAFRFFAPQARAFNRWQPTLEARASMEQPACVHANMDLYKWAAKSMPWIGSDVLLDCFELAMDLRRLDMRASPYDVTDYALEPVPIETAEGRKCYEREQKVLAIRAAPLRVRLIRTLRNVLTYPPSNTLPTELLA